MSTEFHCAPWCTALGTEDEGHSRYNLRGDQSCWGPERKTVFGLESDAPGLGITPIPHEAPGITVYAYLGWYELPKVRLNVFSDAGDIDHDFLLTPFEAIELANHLISVVETIAAA